MLFVRKCMLVLSVLPVASLATNAMAEEFIGFGQAGKPGSWALEEYPEFTHTAPNSNSISTYNELSYFTETGATGTQRDQFEFWVGVNTGYANTRDVPDAHGAGISAPGLGFEYYYQVVTPEEGKRPGMSGYSTFWTSPTLTVNFPNGSSKEAGYGAGANQYSYSLSWANWIQIDKFGITANPVELFYASHNHNATQTGIDQYEKLRGGLSVTLMDVAAGYQIEDDLYAGLHHAYSMNAWRHSDFEETKEGKIGPSMTYLGLAEYGLFICGNVDFDYYTSSNLKKSESISLAIVKNL
ncbi:hypothetical protein MUA04_04340 [Enterobacteriaceae bacterium H11S18]|uniref:hypothetical protein n=1 Tax=Dryocola clanedunensis TaxID=2925396 RepID=UPI0022F03B3C|nr:hypothetical protein [Dryocola clanedunensis]MCT4705521.1 hypothetical protein [Dryocola clanedunensis]MCT4709418.1 hypothetical protein [Dryocola clanedunensis]